MRGNEYQAAAARTIASRDPQKQRKHALYGMASEVGKLLGLYQKVEQGHLLDTEHAMKETGDILWMIAEYCTSMGWGLEEVMQFNVDELRLRYPNGFEPERSLHRGLVDI